MGEDRMFRPKPGNESEIPQEISGEIGEQRELQEQGGEIPEIGKETLKEKAAELYQGLQAQITGALEKYFPKYAEKNRQETLKKRLETIMARGIVPLDYNPEDGVAATVSKDTKHSTRQGNRGKPREASAVKAPGFFDCCGMVLQSPDGVGVVHVSPHVLDEQEGKPWANTEVKIKKDNYKEVITETLRVLYSSEEAMAQDYQPEQWRKEGMPFDLNYDIGRLDLKMGKNSAAPDLSAEQIQQMEQNLKITLFGGNETMMNAMKDLFKKGEYSQQSEKKFPEVTPSKFEFGMIQKGVVASKDEILLVRNADQKIFDLSPKDDDPGK